VRDARAEDADFLAWVLIEASKSHLEVSLFETIMLERFSREELLPLAKQLVTADPAENLFSCWDGFLVAEVDGKPVAGTAPFSLFFGLRSNNF